jgi:thioredoxin reductase
MTTLTPTQIRGLKLAKDGNLFPQAAKKWTHLNAEVTYAKSDRFRERPQKIKFVTTTTLEELKGLGLLERCKLEDQPDVEAHEITMAGKIWLLRNK